MFFHSEPCESNLLTNYETLPLDMSAYYSQVHRHSGNVTLIDYYSLIYSTYERFSGCFLDVFHNWFFKNQDQSKDFTLYLDVMSLFSFHVKEFPVCHWPMWILSFIFLKAQGPLFCKMPFSSDSKWLCPYTLPPATVVIVSSWLDSCWTFLAGLLYHWVVHLSVSHLRAHNVICLIIGDIRFDRLVKDVSLSNVLL